MEHTHQKWFADTDSMTRKRANTDYRYSLSSALFQATPLCGHALRELPIVTLPSLLEYQILLVQAYFFALEEISDLLNHELRQ